MTRKDFEASAAVLARADLRYTSPSFQVVSEGTRRYIAERLANYLSTTNERFDRERFLAACGVTS